MEEVIRRFNKVGVKKMTGIVLFPMNFRNRSQEDNSPRKNTKKTKKYNRSVIDPPWRINYETRDKHEIN